MKMNKLQLTVVIAACFVTVLLRVRDMPIRLDSMIALTLLCGAVVRHPAAIMLPLGIRLFTDVLLWYQTGYGFYSSMVFDYSAYLIIALLARHCPMPRYINMVFGGLVGPCLFFVVSNLGVWFMWPETYPATLAGLTSCYAQGLPFLRSSLAGNLPFALLFLAAWHAATVSATAGSFTAVNSIDQGNEV
ncbi:MAG: DUF6580 family putative transport protein [Planctomycetaceae bacterium]